MAVSVFGFKVSFESSPKIRTAHPLSFSENYRLFGQLKEIRRAIRARFSRTQN